MRNTTRGRFAGALLLGCAAALAGCGGAGRAVGAVDAGGTGAGGGTAGTSGAGGAAGTIDGGLSEQGSLCPSPEVTLEPVADAGAGSCVYALLPPPDVSQDMVPRVLESDQDGGSVAVPQDASHRVGWDYADSSRTVIEIYGAVCDAVRNGSTTLRVTYVCLLP